MGVKRSNRPERVRLQDRKGRSEDATTLVERVRRFKGRRVAVLGDFVADEFLYGDIERISREAPVLILRHARTVVVPGGGGNAVANLRALGAEPLPVGILGRDAAGRGLRAEFRRRKISVEGVVTHPSYETPSKSRILAGGVHTRRQQLVRVDRGGGEGELPAGARRSLRARLRKALRHAEGLLVADYGYGAASPEIVGELLAPLRESGFPILVDSRGRIVDYRRVTACTPNQEEVERALGLPPLEDDATLEQAGRQLLRRTGDQAVLITRGSRGMSVFQRGCGPAHIPAFGSDEVADVTGAGDTVIATFTLALIAGAGFVEAARLSNYAAGLVVMKMGTATVSPAELVRAIRDDPNPVVQ